jgi:hypothetical protein
MKKENFLPTDGAEEADIFPNNDTALLLLLTVDTRTQIILSFHFAPVAGVVRSTNNTELLRFRTSSVVRVRIIRRKTRRFGN